MSRQCSADGRRPSTAPVDTLADSLLPPFQTDAPIGTKAEGDQNDEEIDDSWWSRRKSFRTSRQHHNTKSDKLCCEQSHFDERQEEIWGDQIPLALSLSPSMFFDKNISQQDVGFQQPLPGNDDDDDDDALKTFGHPSWTETPHDSTDESEEDEMITPPRSPIKPTPPPLPIPLHFRSKRNSGRRQILLRRRWLRRIDSYQKKDSPPKDDSPGQDDPSPPAQGLEAMSQLATMPDEQAT
ncbi:hypothetical protein FHL15_007944 [Xylaria flabelliformis]|uniref:Uncharacterized protein n=1 Tax=Xylaria flabelliformis TaxID=2512241 RepID=A0A553HT75_9PEZI|nr:hypothetical protein FHL15_007944 [Xylaria flabelliformis]